MGVQNSVAQRTAISSIGHHQPAIPDGLDKWSDVFGSNCDLLSTYLNFSRKTTAHAASPTVGSISPPKHQSLGMLQINSLGGPS
ncbi:hypothetical protein L917_21378 [Phytophthora nicotianae]|uniref:Uncharacterized protein n=1 Tax=Phytophthora nicotianae TaxID=4792 RepID=W2JZH6_PHYNI|nr:hypothetical protein L917_21378 [Phytophthora nicotianae]